MPIYAGFLRTKKYTTIPIATTIKTTRGSDAKYLKVRALSVDV